MDRRVTKDAYRAAKAAVNPTKEDQQVIYDAADYGFKPDVEEDAVVSTQGSVSNADIPEQAQPTEVLPTQGTPESADTVEEPVQPLSDQPIQDDGTPETVVDDIDRQVLAEREMRISLQREKEANEAELQAEIKKLKEQVNPVTNGDEGNSINIEEALNPDPDKFASDYDMLTHQVGQLVEIIKTQSVRDPRLDGVLSELEDQKKEKETADKERKKEEAAQAFRSDVESFWRFHPDMRPSVDYENAERLYGEFRNNLSEKLNLDATGTAKILAQLHDPVMAENTRKLIESKGIEIHNDIAPIHNTLKVYDYQRGMKIDPASGKPITIRGVQGNTQVLADLDTAFYLMDKKNELVRRQIAVAQATQEKIDMVQGGANAIPSDRLDKVSPDDAMTHERAAAIMADIKKNPRLYSTDPQKVQLKEQVYAKYGV